MSEIIDIVPYLPKSGSHTIVLEPSPVRVTTTYAVGSSVSLAYTSSPPASDEAASDSSSAAIQSVRGQIERKRKRLEAQGLRGNFVQSLVAKYDLTTQSLHDLLQEDFDALS